ncbi:MAG TPA: amidase, partial [Verrucomicrobiae bacterium]|nr:amidase [Verrucomicrobiae bacterium]
MSAAPDALLDLGVVEMAVKIRARKVTPTELAEASVARIARFDPELHAFVTVTRDLALAQARAAES